MLKKTFLAFSVYLLTASFAFAETHIGDFKSVSGTVSVTRQGARVVPEAGSPLMQGDILVTGQDGKSGVSFMDGTRVAVGPNSELVVAEYRFVPLDKEYAFDMQLRKGEAAYASGRMGKLAPEAVKFSTPQTSLGIRGTTFVVRVEQ